MKKSYTKELAVLAFAGLLCAPLSAQVNISGLGATAGGAGPLTVDGDVQVNGNVNSTTSSTTGDASVGGDLTTTGDTTVNGTLKVQPVIAITSTSTDTPTGAGVDPSLGSVGATTTAVVTKLGETDKSESATTGGGATIENNGDATFAASTGTASDANFSRYTTVDVYNAGEPLAGQPVPASQMYYAADAAGTPISPSFATEAALDAWVTATPLTDPAFAALVTTVPTATAGGNVDVGGVLSLAGDSALVPAYAPVPNVAAAIGGNTDAINNEVINRTALIRQEADGIHIGPNSLITDQRGDVAGVGGVQHVWGEDANNDSIDVVIGNPDSPLNPGNFRVLGNSQVDGNQNIDGVLSLGDNGFGGVTDVARSINSNASGIARNRNNIEQNTRGIAMVAALQHTTVLPGMTNALDVGAAYFEGETGMSINYARRINENWQFNIGAASTTDFDESVIKAGVGVQW